MSPPPRPRHRRRRHHLSLQLPYQPTDLAVAPACTATQRRTQLPNKSTTTLSIDLFQYLSLRLFFEEEDLFHFFVSFVWRFGFHFEGAYFRQLRESLFGSLKSGRRGLLTRAKKPFPAGPWCFHPGFKLTARRLPLASNGQGAQISADHTH
jgi:hypothetical protein